MGQPGGLAMQPLGSSLRPGMPPGMQPLQSQMQQRPQMVPNAYGGVSLPPHQPGMPNLMPNGMFREELDINDYPEVVRRQVSHRDLVSGLEESTGAKLQVKGIYSKGKLPEGQKKLYV